jgi:Fe-S-cluster containining protein
MDAGFLRSNEWRREWIASLTKTVDEGIVENEEWVSGKVGFSLHGVPLEFEVTVPATPVKPQRMLPVFQQLANTFAVGAEEVVASEGQPVSCKAGCGACCRQPVPITETEVYHIAELVEGLDEPHRSEVKRRFKAAADHFNSTGWYDRFADHVRRSSNLSLEEGFPEGVRLVREYFAAGVACPFLENESCSIHPDRPVSCREYLVTSPAENCSDLSPTNIARVEFPLKPSKALQKLGSMGDFDEIGFPVLSRALELAERFPEHFDLKPGPEWLKDFFDEALKDEKPTAERSESASDHA